MVGYVISAFGAVSMTECQRSGGGGGGLLQRVGTFRTAKEHTPKIGTGIIECG